VQYAASILSANDALRSTIAAGVIMAGLPFYRNLGIAVATSILGGISVLFIPLLFLLHQYGDRLRARSTFAVSP
jgi:DHA1 family multidrug resistance protein-like MFS transporter